MNNGLEIHIRVYLPIDFTMFACSSSRLASMNLVINSMDYLFGRVNLSYLAKIANEREGWLINGCRHNGWSRTQLRKQSKIFLTIQYSLLCLYTRSWNIFCRLVLVSTVSFTPPQLLASCLGDNFQERLTSLNCWPFLIARLGLTLVPFFTFYQARDMTLESSFASLNLLIASQVVDFL